MRTRSVRQPGNRTQRRAIETRKKLQRAALAAFNEKSVAAVTVEEITEKADVGKGTLYQHFADKDEILITLVGQAVDHLIDRIRSYNGKPNSLESMLEHLLNAHYGFSVDSRDEFLLLFQGKLLVKLQSETLDELEEPYLRYLEEIENRLSSCLSPRIDPLKTRRLACAVAGFSFGFLSFAMIGMTQKQLDKSLRSLRRAFVRSLCEFLGR